MGLSNVRHATMHSYKARRTYRIWVASPPGKVRSLVFKEVSLLPADYPAIAGFPGQPGLPEWDVLHDTAPQLDAIAPRVYHAAQQDSGLQYQYLMEDLSWRYRPCLPTHTVEAAVGRLPQIHSALAAWGEARQYRHRIDWGLSQAEEFLAWVEDSLGRFKTFDTSGIVDEILSDWQRVVDSYLKVDAIEGAPSMLVHGDLNYMNTFLEVDGTGIKPVDWEWMGWGPPHIDLASVLKHAPWGTQRALVRRFFGDDDESHDRNWEIYLWCRLGRNLIDAALHARQTASGLGHTAYDVAAHLRRAREVMEVSAVNRSLSQPVASRRDAIPQREDVTEIAEPMLTIALPVLNGDRYLAMTLDSLLSQSFTDFELIVADNASTDGTADIIEEFASRDGRIRVLQRDETVGAHYNYNDLVSIARGKYFKWAAHDDLYESEFLELCVKELERHPEAVLAYPQTVDIDSEGEFIADRPLNVDLSKGSAFHRFRAYLAEDNACEPIFGVHRTAALRASGLLGHYAGSDAVLLAELTLYGPFHEVPHPLFLHREHDGRSVNTRSHPRWRAAWFHPGRTGPDPYHWKELYGYVRAVATAPISSGDRLRGSLLLIGWSVRRVHKLIRDLVAVGAWRIARSNSPNR